MSDIIETLTSSGKRTKIHDAVFVVKAPARAKELVNALAAERNVSEAVIVREALGEYFERRGITG